MKWSGWPGAAAPVTLSERVSVPAGLPRGSVDWVWIVADQSGAIDEAKGPLR